MRFARRVLWATIMLDASNADQSQHFVTKSLRCERCHPYSQNMGGGLTNTEMVIGIALFAVRLLKSTNRTIETGIFAITVVQRWTNTRGRDGREID